MGQEDPARKFARRNITAWHGEYKGAGLDAIVINTSGCGTTVKDYGHLFAGDSDHEMAGKAAVVADLACDITEFLTGLDLDAGDFIQPRPALRVAYHSACSLQHGQQVRQPPKELLKLAGFDVCDIPESHICCGSAGTYNLLQPELSRRLRERKGRHIRSVAPDVVAAGNIGCIAQIGAELPLPVVHSVELLDWASGGPKPAGLADAVSGQTKM
jgi:glycolate oxidase iron-sulfur subunit